MRPLIVTLLIALLGAPAVVADDPYRCNMAALSEEELVHYGQLATALHASVLETKELKNGFAFKLPADGLVGASQWIAYERKCCPFFEFELEIGKDSGPVWLKVTGDRGIKDFIRTEFEL